MRSKILLSVLVIALAAALLAGATGAWFTGTADLAEAEFTAGTVEVNADKVPTITPMPERSFENVNPGDCATVCWEIANTGTKKAELRVEVEDGWLGDNLADKDRVVYYFPAKDSDWVLYEDGEDMWLYYTGGPVNSGTTVDLCLVVAFEGRDMGNEYADKSYQIGGLVQAIQASNEAPSEKWGSAWWNATDENYNPINNSNISEFFDGVKDTICYTGTIEEPEELKTELEVLKRTRPGGSNVQVLGDVEDDEYELDHWSDPYNYNSMPNDGFVTWIIEDGNATLTAHNREYYGFKGWYDGYPVSGNSKTHRISGDFDLTIENSMDKTIYAVFEYGAAQPHDS